MQDVLLEVKLRAFDHGLNVSCKRKREIRRDDEMLNSETQESSLIILCALFFKVQYLCI